MIADEIREKLQNIVRGELHQGQSDSCTAVRNLLCESFGASPTVKSEFEGRSIIKEEQVEFLKSHAQKADLWMESLPKGSQYLTEGGESKVYLSEDGTLAFGALLGLIDATQQRLDPKVAIFFPCYKSSSHRPFSDPQTALRISRWI